MFTLSTPTEKRPYHHHDLRQALSEIVSGRPLLIYWSFETPRDEYAHTSLGDRLVQIADLVIHFVTKTRWRRTFQFVQ